MKEKFCEKYFKNNVKPKHLSEFKQKTPKGHEIRGYICRKANMYLGSLVITHITEKNGVSYDVEQFVQSFPKIHYWDKRYQLKEDSPQIIYHCQEKLDGTCLIFYSLNDDEGNPIEIIPKTRGQAVADKNVLDMLRFIDKKAIDEFFKKPNHADDILMFELFGILNRHEISYMDTYIDIKLIGAYVEGIFLNYLALHNYSDLDDFKTPSTLFTIEKYPNDNSFSIKWQADDTRLRKYKIECDESFPTLYDAIQEVKFMLEKINEEYLKFNSRNAVEGVVINGEYKNGGQLYLKIKPRNTEIELTNAYSVPRRFVLKEVQKYFDEFGSKVLELYETDKTHYIDYVKRQLREEFSYEQIEDPKTLRRINNIFMDVWDSKMPPKSIQNICDELINEYPDEKIADLMKIFAKTYPTKKKYSRHVYTILSKRCNNGRD